MALFKVACLVVCAVPLGVQACPTSALGVVPANPAIGQPWLDNQFVYLLSHEVASDPAKTDSFISACTQLLETTALNCIPLSQVPDASDYVYVIDGSHDFSFIGRQGGCQLLSILTWNNPIVVAHEIKHALGWAHEQQHPDRDRYLNVNLEAVPARYRAEFQLRDLGNEGPYDFDSIMHFSARDLAKPGEVVLRPRAAYSDSSAVMGQRDHLSETDLAEIRDVYGAAERQ